MTEQTFDVDGLHCGGCVNTVRETLLGLDGVIAVIVTLGTGAPSVVNIESVNELDTNDVQQSLSARGEFRIRG